MENLKQQFIQIIKKDLKNGIRSEISAARLINEVQTGKMDEVEMGEFVEVHKGYVEAEIKIAETEDRIQEVEREREMVIEKIQRNEEDRKLLESVLVNTEDIKHLLIKMREIYQECAEA